MKHLPRHLSIALAAGLFAFFVIPDFAGKLKNVSPYELRIYSAVVSALLWFSLSAYIPKPALKKWMIAGFLSPFLGFPLVYKLAATYPNNSFVTGFQLTLVLSWILIPGGLLMGLIASGISKWFEPGHAK
jgi:hypothetical protein